MRSSRRAGWAVAAVLVLPGQPTGRSACRAHEVARRFRREAPDSLTPLKAGHANIQSKDRHNRTMGFVCLGPVSFVSTEGSQPMNITWRLHTPLPPWLWHSAAKLAVG